MNKVGISLFVIWCFLSSVGARMLSSSFQIDMFLFCYMLIFLKVLVYPIYYQTPTRFPYKTPIPAKLTIIDPPPTSFSIQMTATHATITPSTVTFNSNGMNR